jgi:pimeloyl-ACP methyl ester carboxylesterase
MNANIASELFPYASSEFSVDGHTMRYIDEGSGDETILCVHGNPTWSFYYRRVIERFSATHRVIAVDHLGCGRSDKPKGDACLYRFASHRDRLVRLIEHFDLNQVTLLAHDWGGAIGLSALLKSQSRFERIMLLNTGAFIPPFIPLRISACRIPVLGSLGVRGANLFAGAAIRMAMSRQRLSDHARRGLLAPYGNWANRIAIDRFVKDIPMNRKHPTYGELESLGQSLGTLSEMPSLLVWGMRDWCFRPECLRRFQSEWPNAKSLEIADAGHYVIEDAPEETLDAISDFLSV